jgi:trk system potassium uptake protein TrkA
MKKRFALIGLGSFGRRMLDDLLDLDVELIVIDKQSELIEKYKDRVSESYVVDVNDDILLERFINPPLDYAIVDLGDHLESSILVTHFLRKIKVGRIVVRAESERQGEILRIIGASEIIYPPREAVRSILPRLVSTQLLKYLHVGSGIVMAEVEVPSKYRGKPMKDLRLRQISGINVVAIKNGAEGEYFFFSPDYCFADEDIVLIVGPEADVASFAGIPKKLLQGVG